MKKWIWILIVGIFLVIILILVFFLLNKKSENVQNFQDFSMPLSNSMLDMQKIQSNAIKDAEKLYIKEKKKKLLYSQCLGIVGDEVKYAVDIVHKPRIQDDNLPENRCKSIENREVNHFIELTPSGELVRIV